MRFPLLASGLVSALLISPSAATADANHPRDYWAAIVANKFKGVRAAACCDEVMAEMCRRHNDVNILCLPGDLIGDRPVGDLVRIWLATEFEGGRHSRRLEKIEGIEKSELK